MPSSTGSNSYQRLLDHGGRDERQGQFDPEQLLADARGGRTESLGRVLELSRTDLALLARAELISNSRAASMPRIWSRRHSSMPAATSTTSAARAIENRVAWLRKILFYNLARLVQRQVAAKKRSTRREVSLDQRASAMERSSGTIQIETALVSRSSSPSSHAGQRKRAACLADQLARLPADYREVLVLRNLEGLPFPEVARRMGRSAGAVRILWVRGRSAPPAAASGGTLMNAIVPLEEELEPTSEVISILEEFLTKLEAGARLNPEDMTARCPALAEPLKACLASLEFLHRRVARSARFSNA